MMTISPGSVTEHPADTDCRHAAAGDGKRLYLDRHF